ncbi:MAG: lantibiotic dehydratase [Acidobacteriia bacterium]|nr:lantibiotic dehydratase [Terriglobia bacterium]
MKEFTPSGFFVLRTPLFPLQEFLDFSSGLACARALSEGGDLATAAAGDRRILRARLQEIARRPEVREALWVASPDFFDSLSAWLESPPGEKGQKIEQSFYRYLARMTSRPTPFGLFAGCSVGMVGAETRLEIGSRSQYFRRSRLDMEYLYNLAEKIASEPALRQHVSFRANTSIYMAAGRYHHVQGYMQEKARFYRLVATEYTPYLEATLQRAATGATPLTLAAALVQDDPEISMEEAAGFIGQLIETQLLIAEIVPPITGPEPIDDMIAQLNHLETSPLAASLSGISSRLQKLDAGRLGNDLEEYRALVSAIRELPAEFQIDHLVQVDMMKPAPEACLDQRLIADLQRGIDLLHSIQTKPTDPLRQFKDAFQERYQDQEVPLVQALDEEVGIGFETRSGPGSVAEPLIDDLDFATPEDEQESSFSQRDATLLRKVEELTRKRGTALELTALELDEKLLEILKVKDPLPLPDALAVMFTMGAQPPAGMSGKPALYLQSASGPSGAILLGRFCHADRKLTECVERHLRAEEALRANASAVFAEIAHLPEGRVGNVLFRPLLRKYEIPFLATSRAPAGDQIPVTDLLVSLQAGKVVLRSRRLGCEVIPRLTSAHGFAHGRNLKTYKFLCLLQMQGLAAGLSWSWGALEHLAFLPRVTHGNIVFALARWRVEKEIIEPLAKEQGEQRLLAVHRWRKAAGLPRLVLLAESDNQLLIDFENALSIDTLIEYAKKRPYIRLIEVFPDPESQPVRGPEGRFTHEIVLPLVRERRASEPAQGETAVPAPGITSVAATAEEQRSFFPGSEWLFAKIYASPANLDHLLLESVKPLVEKVLAAGEADGWFFIRYGDPQWHLRLRFHGDPQKLSARVLPQLRQSLSEQAGKGNIWRVQLDTYEREIERYGGHGGIVVAERLFQIDSELALALLGSIPDLGSKMRWQIAFTSANQLLAGLGFDIATRRLIVNNMGKSQEKNFSVTQNYRKQISDRFRGERAVLEKLLDDPSAGELPEAAWAALQSYAARLAGIREELERRQQSGALTASVQDLAGSFIHMHLNRLFRSAPNAQEMVIYDFLARSYDSRLAREKRSLK